MFKWGRFSGELNKIKSLIKNNWKNIIFMVIYMFACFLMLSVALEILDIIGWDSFSLYPIIFLTITLFSALSLIAKFIVERIFKEEAAKVMTRTSIALVSTGIITGIWAVIGMIKELPSILETSSVFGEFMLIFLVPAYLFLTLLCGSIFALSGLLAFALLKLAINHTRIVVAAFIVSSTLCFIILISLV